MPCIDLPNFTTDNLNQAIDVLRLCQKDALPKLGFPLPYIAPGGYYGGMWWQLDYSIAMTGLLWFDYEAACQGIKNYASCQKPDGRIPLWGNDGLPEYNGERLQREQVSSLPKLFDAINKILRRTDDCTLIEEAYLLMKRNLDWWLTNRYDKETGLFSAVFEETFIPYYGYAGEYAPVDLNVELVHGFHIAADVALRLGRLDENLEMKVLADKLAHKIDECLWDANIHFYVPLLLKSQTHYPVRMASAFAALRYRIASPDHKKVLLDAMTDVAHFNWNTRALTSVDIQDKAFTLVSGRYIGNPCWSGSVWSLTNENAIRGLVDYGEKALAADLLVHTLDLFKTQYCEFLNPQTGEPCGVMDYAWTAAHCLDLIFSVLLGIDYDVRKQSVTIAPILPENWCRAKQVLTVKELTIPGQGTLNLKITCDSSPIIEAALACSNGQLLCQNACGTCTIKIPY